MEMKATYKVTNLQALRSEIVKRLLPKVEAIICEQVDLYLQDLEKHMGTIKGTASYRSGKLHWQALDEETLEEAPLYWQKTGKAKNSISVNIKTHNDGITAFVGIAENAPGYQEALWNELGFTPRNGDRLVRRPLFFPLAEEHKAAIEVKIRKSLSRQSIRLEI